MIKEQARTAALVLLAMIVLTGVVYPLLVRGVAMVAFPRQAEGSLTERQGVVVGSALVGQSFDDDTYFWGRPSATALAYDAAASSGSNAGPLNAGLHQAVAERVARLHASDPDNRAPVPVDLVTASASGLDPHVTPAAAYWQVARVARARSLPDSVVRSLVDEHVEPRTLGVLGEPRVNVLRLNLALDDLSAPGTAGR
jgi:K+-transporting ATPase ATPase C chain